MISETGRIHGRGSMPFKWVSGLTPAEREHVQNGGIVLVQDTSAHTHMQCGWKRVTYSCGHYNHREANPEEIATEGGTR